MTAVKIAVIGGDRRQAVLAELLAKEGFECAVYGLDGVPIGDAARSVDLGGALNGASAVILPLPALNGGGLVNAPFYEGEIRLKEVLDLAGDEAVFIGGMVAENDFPRRKVRDYYREELVLLNTVPTAEGAVAIAMNELETTISGTRALILGFGRVGKTLSLLLRGFGASVSVATRNPTERAVCEILRFDTLEYAGLKENIGCFGLIFNTVPAPVLTAELLAEVQDGTPVIDLASRPGAAGADKTGKNVIWAKGLPGKQAPVSAGRYIKNAVLAILKEENII